MGGCFGRGSRVVRWGLGHGPVAPVSDEDLHDASLMALGVEQLRRLSVGQTPLGAKLWL